MIEVSLHIVSLTQFISSANAASDAGKKEKGNLQNKTCGNISTYLNWDIVAVSNSKGVKLLHS